jgi:hypothetical protein
MEGGRMKRGRPKTGYAVKALSRDLLERIRRAEWMQERKEAEVKGRTRTPQRPASCASWGQIVKAMR